MIGGVALIVIILLIVLISSGGGGSSEQPVPLKRLVGQTIVAKLGAKGPDQALIKRVKQGPGRRRDRLRQRRPDSCKADVQQLQSAASDGGNPPLLVMVDQEGGDVKRLKDGPPDTRPQQLGKSGGRGPGQGPGAEDRLLPEGARGQRRPRAGPRRRPADHRRHDQEPHLRLDPDTVASVGVAFAQGLQDGGVVATAKHFPGLGRATVNTDDRAGQHRRDDAISSRPTWRPSRPRSRPGVGMVMVSTASYPTLGPKKPAAFSPDDRQGPAPGGSSASTGS